MTSAIDPTSPVLDNFNRANGGAGSKWSVIKPSGFALMNVSANTAVDASTSLYAWNYWNVANFGPDAEAYATVASYAGDTIRIGARVTVGSSYSGYFVSVTATGAWSIIRIDNGSAVTLASGITQTLASGDKVAIRVAGSVVTALHYTSSGWAQVLSYDTSSDAVRYTTAGRLSVEFRAGALDDFGGGTITAPVNTQAPSVSGTVAVGQQLQASAGSWTGTPAPTFSYQWQDCDSNGNNCSPIVGATASSYTIQAGDGGYTLKVTVTGSNTAGSSQAASAPTTLVPQAPLNTQRPQISGTVAVGQQLQASSGSWTGTPAPTFAYQWEDCDAAATDCSPIPGATASSYTVQSTDVGFALGVVVTGSNSAGSSQAASAPTTVVPRPQQAPVNTQAPQISGTVAVGQQLLADPGSWSGTPAPTFTYQWQDCDSGGNNCTPILGATAGSYTIQSADGGFALEVVVTGSNSAGSSQAASAPTSVVPQAPANSQAPQISGTVAVGQQLQASAGSWTGTPAPTFSYQWQDCDSGGNNCSPILGATASSYTIQSTDVGFTLEVVVTGSNSAGSSQAASAPTTVVPSAAGAGQHAGSADQRHGRCRPAAAGERGQLDGHAGADLQLPVAGLRQRRQQLQPDPGATASSYTIQSSRRRLRARGGRHRLQQRRQQPGRLRRRPPSCPSRRRRPSTRKRRRSRARSRSASSCRPTRAAGRAPRRRPSPTSGSDCDSGGNNCNPIQGATASQLHDHRPATSAPRSRWSSPAPTAPAAARPPPPRPPSSRSRRRRRPTRRPRRSAARSLSASSCRRARAPGRAHRRRPSPTSGRTATAAATTATRSRAPPASSYTIQSTRRRLDARGGRHRLEQRRQRQAASAPTSVVPQAPVNTQAPQISGTVAVGQQLQASPGSWTGTPAPTFTYQWQDCDSGGNNCSPIQGATASSYTIQSTDGGSTLKVVVTGSNTAGSSQATSAPTAVVDEASDVAGVGQLQPCQRRSRFEVVGDQVVGLRPDERLREHGRRLLGVRLRVELLERRHLRPRRRGVRHRRQLCRRHHSHRRARHPWARPTPATSSRSPRPAPGRSSASTTVAARSPSPPASRRHSQAATRSASASSVPS